jgi:nucleoside permease NupC
MQIFILKNHKISTWIDRTKVTTMDMDPASQNENDVEQSVMDELLDTVEDGSKMARITGTVLKFLMAFLSIAALVLMFKLGEIFWPAWMIEYRRQILGIVMFALVGFVLWSPIMIEATANTRTLSGPGRVRRGEPWRPDDF